MSVHDAEIDRLVEAAWQAPDKVAQTNLLNRAIELADAAGDADRGWDLRKEIFEPACFGGQIDLLLLHFAWCIAAADRDPERFEAVQLLWTYKWVIDEATNFPHVPLARLESMADDFGRRARQIVEGSRTIPYAKGIVALCTYNHGAARQHYEAWRDARRDWLSDCPACEANRVVELHANLHEDEAALAAAHPLLERTLVCREVPIITYGELHLPALRLGMPALARRFFTTGFRKVDRDPKLIRTVGHHLQFLALTHSTKYGLDVLARNVANVIAAPAILQRLPFWLGAELLMRRLSGGGTVTVDFPSTFPLVRADRTYDPAMLADHFAGLVDDLSRRFDARNGNTYLSDHAAHVRSLLDRVEPNVMPPPRRRAAAKKPPASESAE